MRSVSLTTECMRAVGVSVVARSDPLARIPIVRVRSLKAAGRGQPFVGQLASSA